MVRFSGRYNFISPSLKHYLSFLLNFFVVVFAIVYSVNKLLTIFEQSNLIKSTEETIKIRKGAF